MEKIEHFSRSKSLRLNRSAAKRNVPVQLYAPTNPVAWSLPSVTFGRPGLYQIQSEIATQFFAHLPVSLGNVCMGGCMERMAICRLLYDSAGEFLCPPCEKLLGESQVHLRTNGGGSAASRLGGFRGVRDGG